MILARFDASCLPALFNLKTKQNLLSAYVCNVTKHKTSSRCVEHVEMPSEYSTRLYTPRDAFVIELSFVKSSFSRSRSLLIRSRGSAKTARAAATAMPCYYRLFTRLYRA